jgi:thiamine-monophosphate kinase
VEHGSVPLDEPSKLREIVVPTLGPTESQEMQLGNGAHSKLLLGALGQDDCAAYLLTGTQVLVAGSDYVRGPKFHLYELGLIDNYDIGWYLAGANLSDIAAMGAQPLGLLSVVRYPKNLADSAFRLLIEGIRDCCATVGARNVGGDIGSAERIILSASAFGVVEPDSVLSRGGARSGQLVVTTGATGLAGSAMRIGASPELRSRLGESTYQTLLQKWRRVSPRVQHGRIFARNGGVTSCIDTSDGLKGALDTLASCSKVSLDIDPSSVPIHPAVAAAAEILKIDSFELVFGDSVDFELVATVDEDSFDDLAQACNAAALDLYVLGRVGSGSGAHLTTGSQRESIPGDPWRHT